MKRIWIYLMVIGAAGFWGANFNVGKLAVSVMPPLSVVAWRFILAAVLMWIVFLVKDRQRLRAFRTFWLHYTLLGIIGIFATNAFLFVGLRHTSPINASLVMATNPLVTALMASVLLHERVRVAQIAGTLVSLLGVLFVLTGGSVNHIQGVSGGDVLVLCGNICWALYGVLGRKYLRNSSPLATSAYTMLVGALCFVPFAGFTHAVVPQSTMASAWSAIGFMAVFGSVLAYLWWNRGIAVIGASRTSLFFNLVPVSTMILTACSGIMVEVTQLCGSAVVIAGVILASRTGKAVPASPAAYPSSARSM